MLNHSNLRGATPVLFLLVLAMFGTVRAQQTGEIHGKILDSTTVEPLVGATVVLNGTTLGGAADIDGQFVVRRVPPGTYDLRVSMIGYAGKVVKGVVVIAGDPVTLNISLAGAEVSVDEVVVTADAVRSTEGALLMERKRASAIGDGVSEEQIKKTPDATSAEVLKRIPSVTIVDNKYLLVRGNSERYNGAMLNNTSVSTSEPDKKSFAFDLIPSNLIENTILTKSFTPDQPGDFSGGLLKINTVDFPDRFMSSLSYVRGYNNITTGSAYATYAGGARDKWAVDDGTRAVPGGFPENLRGQTPAQLLTDAKKLNNVWAPTTKSAPMNGNYSLSIGNQFNVFDQVLGVVGSASYRDGFDVSSIERNDYEGTGETRFHFNGIQSRYSVQMGGLANIGLKLFQHHKIMFKNTFTRSATDEVITLEGIDNDVGSEQQQSALKYVSTEIVSNQLFGEHEIPVLSGINAEWRVYQSRTQRDEPDYRRLIYGREIGSSDPYYAVLGPQANLKNGGRYWSDLHDDVRGGAFDIGTPVLGAKLKAGALYDEKQRYFDSRLIGMIVNGAGNGTTDFRLYYLPPDSIFAPENFRRNGFTIDEYQNGSNQYTANQYIRAAYGMADYGVASLNLRLIAGARYERSVQTINTMDYSNRYPLVVNKVFEDVLPSVNIVYSPRGNSNVRFAYSQTINRPELRELAPFSYYDFSTQTSLHGNVNLVRTLIRNYDLRYEFFPGIGEVLSGSLFYKAFSNPIEQVVIPSNSLGAERTYQNAERARNYGFELEARKSMVFLGDYGSNVVMSVNYSWIRSKVEFSDDVLFVQASTRPLQGQSNYVINLGLSFVEPTMNTSVTLLYNRFGERIAEVATAYDDNIIEQPRDMVDLVVTQNFFSILDLKFSAKDILHQSEVFMQGEKVSRINSRGSVYSLGLNVRI